MGAPSLETYMGGARQPAGDKHDHVTVVPPHRPVNKLRHRTPAPAPLQSPRAGVRLWSEAQHPRQDRSLGRSLPFQGGGGAC